MTEVTSITSGSLIAAEKVNGTNGHNLAGDNLCMVDDIMRISADEKTARASKNP